jgi:hypothetical protein
MQTYQSYVIETSLSFRVLTGFFYGESYKTFCLLNIKVKGLMVSSPRTGHSQSLKN